MSFWGGCQFILCAKAHLEGCSDWNQSQLAIAPFSVCWFVNNHFIWGSLSENCFISRSLWTPGFNRKWRPHIWLSKWSTSFSRNRFLTCLFLQFNRKYKACIHVSLLIKQLHILLTSTFPSVSRFLRSQEESMHTFPSDSNTIQIFRETKRLLTASFRKCVVARKNFIVHLYIFMRLQNHCYFAMSLEARGCKEFHTTKLLL